MKQRTKKRQVNAALTEAVFGWLCEEARRRRVRNADIARIAIEEMRERSLTKRAA